MRDLIDFLIDRNYDGKEITYTFKNGKDEYPIKYKPILPAKYGELKLKCRTVDSSGMPIMDTVRLSCEVIAECVKSPNFLEAAKKCGLATPTQFISTKFSPVEIDDIANIILTCSGVDEKSKSDEAEEVKNL